MGVSKYIATAIGIILMIWTYDLAHSERDVALEQRRGIESNLEDMISQYIKARRPGVTDVIFQQLYSEDIASANVESANGTTTEAKQMLVHFRYLTNEPSTNGELTEQVFEGSVRLRSTDGSTWQWMDENVHSPLIRYKNGTEIKASDSSKESSEDPAK